MADQKFKHFLKKFSSFYVGNDFLEFKFCMWFHLPIPDIVDDKATPFLLLTKLEQKSTMISPTNVRFLLEIAELTRIVKATDCVKEYQGQVQVSGEGLSPVVKLFYKGMIAAAEYEFVDVQAFYTEISGIKFESKWNILFSLIEAQKLNSYKEAINFANLLNPTAKSCILNGLEELYKSQNPDNPGNEETRLKAVLAELKPMYGK